MIQDSFGRLLKDLRISVTDRCNLRCPYCMPAKIYGERYQFLAKDQILTFEEIARLSRLFVKLGVSKLRLTGGEPLLRPHLDRLIAVLADLTGVEDLTLTTNGYLLEQQAQALKDAGLQRITVSLDSLDDNVLRRMNGGNYGPERVLRGIAKAEELGLRPIKINTVVQRGVNDHTLVDLARYFKGSGHIVRFIEFMDVGTLNGWTLDKVITANDIFQRINAEMPLEPMPPNYPGEVAERFRYIDGDGEVGIIGSVTRPFCGTCARARISTSGRLFTCLFSDVGFDLSSPLRSGVTDQELEHIVRNIWGKRTDRYSEIRASLTERDRKRKKIEMYAIGG